MSPAELLLFTPDTKSIGISNRVIVGLISTQTANCSLVLYSHEHEAWKIADFGLTSEGSSQKACSTRYSRGTPGYRAPELLREDGKYTNKVDIWALGCILYELVFETKAFQSDWDVQYSKCNDSLRERLRLLTETERNPDMTAKSFASKIMCEMLDIDPSKRPSAEQVHRIFSLGMDQSLCHSCKSLYEQCEELNQVDVQEFSRNSLVIKEI